MSETVEEAKKDRFRTVQNPALPEGTAGGIPAPGKTHGNHRAMRIGFDPGLEADHAGRYGDPPHDPAVG